VNFCYAPRGPIPVVPGGNDATGFGLSPNDPCATISNGITRAQAEGFSCVFVQAGVYPEVLVQRLARGIAVLNCLPKEVG